MWAPAAAGAIIGSYALSRAKRHKQVVAAGVARAVVRGRNDGRYIDEEEDQPARSRQRTDTGVAGGSEAGFDREEEGSRKGVRYVMDRKKLRSGRKLPITQYMNRVLKNNVIHVRERFGAITDPSDVNGTNRGAYWLNHGTVSVGGGAFINIDGTNYASYVAYPVHVWPIGNTSQNPTYVSANNVGNGGYELIGANVAALPNKMAWKRLGGWSRTVSVLPGTYPNGTAGPPTAVGFNIVAPEVVDNEYTTTVNLGRQSLLEWYKIKTLVYGKKTRPTMIKFSIVQFMDERLSPDWWWFLGPTGNAVGTSVLEAKTFDGSADEFWRGRIRPLIANPCSEGQRIDNSAKMKVVATKTVTINSKESVDSDADPEQQFIQWFNRVNKRVDFGTFSTGAVDNLTDANNQNPNFVAAPAVDIGQCPVNEIKKNLYLVVESYQPDREDYTYAPANALATNPTNSLTASYDCMLRKSWAVVE